MSDTSLPTESKPVSVPAETPAVRGKPGLDETVTERPAADPTRYGDWEKNGRCIDF
ncbi:MAG: DUF1674 domain-containing protein [Rhodanobacter sp.]|nr:MAG: DUF1674 domain-containing protein [Rhodanobacter sp.]